MGRGRVEIKKIENQTQRQSTFYKRRDGLFKKARELAILCDSDLLLLLFSPSGKLYHYHSPSVPSAQDLIRRYEAATQSGLASLKEAAVCDVAGVTERNKEVEKTKKMCEVLERQLRFMMVEENHHYSPEVLDILENNLEVAIAKVRWEKDTKIRGEISHLEGMVRDGQQERFGLCEKLAHVEELKAMGFGAGGSTPPVVGSFGYELDLKLGTFP